MRESLARFTVILEPASCLDQMKARRVTGLMGGDSSATTRAAVAGIDRRRTVRRRDAARRAKSRYRDAEKRTRLAAGKGRRQLVKSNEHRAAFEQNKSKSKTKKAELRKIIIKSGRPSGMEFAVRLTVHVEVSRN